jgi:hypothetical protein
MEINKHFLGMKEERRASMFKSLLELLKYDNLVSSNLLVLFQNNSTALISRLIKVAQPNDIAKISEF